MGRITLSTRFNLQSKPSGGEDVVGRQRTTDTLERKLAHRLDGHSVLDRHKTRG